MMHYVQKQTIYEAFNCGEALQLTFLTKKEQQLIYYRAEVENGAFTKTTSLKTVYLHEDEATFALKFEPWILDTTNSLSQVHDYQKKPFGDGATLKLKTMFDAKALVHLSQC